MSIILDSGALLAVERGDREVVAIRALDKSLGRQAGVLLGRAGSADVIDAAVLREDPDVVLVGEMRDTASITAALTIAETGHLVFATLHTNDTAQTLDRIVDVFPAEQQPQVRLQLAHTLLGIVNQQLIPKIGGGRVAAFEVLVGTPAVHNLIREGKTRQLRNLVSTGQRFGMQTLEACLTDLVGKGLVAYYEAVLLTLHPDETSARWREGRTPTGHHRPEGRMREQGPLPSPSSPGLRRGWRGPGEDGTPASSRRCPPVVRGRHDPLGADLDVFAVGQAGECGSSVLPGSRWAWVVGIVSRCWLFRPYSWP